MDESLILFEYTESSFLSTQYDPSEWKDNNIKYV